MLLIKNKIQTSQKSVTKMFKKIQTDQADVNSAMKTWKFDEPRINGDYRMKVLTSQRDTNVMDSPEHVKEMRKILEVVKRKEMENYQ